MTFVAPGIERLGRIVLFAAAVHLAFAAGGIANILVNPSFADPEPDGVAQPWSHAGSLTTSRFADGSFAVTGSTNSSSYVTIASQCVEIPSPTATYDFSGWINIPAQTDTASVETTLFFFDTPACGGTPGAIDSGNVITVPPNSANVWLQSSGTAAPPGGTVSVLFAFRLLSVTAPGTVNAFVDDASLSPPENHWNNVSGGNWNVDANWSLGHVPTANEVAVIDDCCDYTVTLDTNATVAGLYVGSVDGVATLVIPSFTLTVNGSTLIDQLSSELQITGGSFVGNGDGQVLSKLTWTGGKIGGSGTTVIEPPGILAISGTATKTLEAHTLRNEATTGSSWSGTGAISGTFGATFENAGTFDITAPAVFQYSCCSTPPVFRNLAGAVVDFAVAGTTRFSNSAFDNDGTVLVTSGAISLEGGGTSTGTFDVAGSLAFAGSSSHVLGSGADLTGTGTITLSSGTLEVAAPVSSSVGSFEQTGGTLTGTGALTIDTSYTWMAGTMSGAGSTDVAPGATLSLSGPGTKSLSQRVINNGGTAFWSAGAISGSFGAAIDNGATFNASADSSFSYSCCSQPPLFNNLAGATFTRSGIGTTSFQNGALFNNSGTVNVTGGSLSLRDGASTGPFSVGTGATLAFLAGTHTLGAGASFTGTGTVALSGATLSIDAPVTTAATNFAFSSGTLTGPGALTVTSGFTWTGGTMSGTGTTSIDPTGSLAISGSSSKTINTRTIQNAGLGTWSGTGWIFGSGGAVLENAGTFDASAEATFTYSCCSIPPMFDNLAGGSFIRSGTGTTTFQSGALFNNGGSVSVIGGTLTLEAGTSPGSFDAAAGAVLTFSGSGIHTLSGTMTGAGTIAFSGITANITAAYTVAGLTRITGGTANFNSAASLTDLDLTGGTLGGTGNLDVSGNATWTGGTIAGSGTVTFGPGSTFALSGSTKILTGRTVRNEGTATWSGTGWIFGSGGGILQNAGTFDASAEAAFTYSCCSSPPTFDNVAGGSFIRSGTGTTSFQSGALFNNAGSVAVIGGTLAFAGSPFVQTAGTFTIGAGTAVTTTSTFDLQGGLLLGDGTIVGDVLNSGATVSPGASPGVLTIDGDYAQGSSGSLGVELSGTAAGEFDQLIITGTATLGGTLNVALVPPFYPADGDAFRIMTFGSVAPSPNDQFTTLNGPALNPGDALPVVYDPTFVDLVMNGNYAPAAVADSAGISEDTAAPIDVLANDTDNDGDSLTIVSNTAPANGTALCSTTTCTYTPNPDFFGSDSFTYTISDGFISSTATVSVTVAATNDPPVAANDSFSTTEDAPLTVSAPGVLANDTDVESSVLTAVLVSGTSNGTLSLNADGSFSYTPNADFSGSDSFTYKASDGTNVSNVATVTISVGVVDDPPTASPDSATTDSGVPVSINVLANDSDPDSETLTLSSNTSPSNGSVSCSAAGVCTYTSNAGFSGTDSFTYTVTDGSGSASSTVTIEVIGACPNDVPPLLAPANGATELDSPVTFQWRAVADAIGYDLFLLHEGAVWTLAESVAGGQPAGTL
ncbi:MAG: beta strand repeat-containing protein, partial [Thermoanaerobaculia bacterium]